MKNLAIRRVQAVCLVFAALGTGQAALGDNFQPKGRWVLVNDWGWPIEQAIFDVIPTEDGFDIRLIAAPRNLGTAEVKNFTCHNGRVTFALASERAKAIEFDGTLAVEGQYAGQVVGTTQWYSLEPARLKRTTTDHLMKFKGLPYEKQVEDAMNLADKRERAAKLMKIVQQHPGPETNKEFRPLLASAEEADLTEAQVRDLLRLWFAAAEPYGPAFRAEARLVVLRSLRGQPKFAPIALEVAEAACQNLGDLASAEDRSSLLHFLADAAELSGRRAEAAAAKTRADKIDARLDADYREKVPPFKVDAYAGRKRPEANRIVLLELFTGASCSPCVAPDVACDALDSAFKSSELITLQYHLNIPGVDPLTNPSTIARQNYYGFRGVPTAFFNGDECSSGGGDMTAAKAKYHEYHQRIKSLLEKKRSADIDLSVRRSDDDLAIHAIADATPFSKQSAGTKENDHPNPEPALRLRLVLTEELVRFDGGNGVRFNRHVVRSFAGSPEGTPLQNGRAELELTIKLGQIRDQLREYLHSMAPTLAAFSHRPLPELELKRLALVAFIQDDATKHVLHAVSIPVPGE